MAMRLSLIINADGSAAIEAIDRVRGSVGNLDREAGRAAGGGMAGLTSQLKSLAMTAAAGIGVAELARAFVSVNVATERTQKALEAVTGSTALAQQEMTYLREVANRMGIGLQDAASAYVSLSAAAKGTALEGQAAKDIFEAVSLAMGKLGKSSADTEGALLAIQQMISKGVVSAEELRGQLGERLPGAFGLAAKAMGVTEQELGKMLEKGEILAKDLLPALTDELNKTYNDGKRIGGLDKEWERFKTAMEQSAVGINHLTSVIETLGNMLQWAAEKAERMARGMQAVANWRQGLGLQTFATQADEFNARVGKMITLQGEFAAKAGKVAFLDALGGLGNKLGLATAQEQLRDLGTALGEATSKVAQMQNASVAASKAQSEANRNLAASFGPTREMYEQHIKKVREDEIAVVKLAGAYDEQAAKQAKIMEYQDKLNESVKQYTESNGKLGISQDVANKYLAEYTKSLDKNDKGHKAAAASAKAFDKDFAALVHKFLPARDDADKMAKATAILDKALAEGRITALEYAKAMERVRDEYGQATNAAQALIDKYDREGAVTRELAKDKQELNALIAEGGPQADQARLALEKLTQQEQDAALEAVKSAGGFKAAWVDAVQSLDGAVEGLWKGLITGQKDVLKSLKSYLLDWVSRLSYELLLKPIILPIQASLYNMAGVAMPGVTAASGMGGTGGTSLLSGISNIGSWFTGNSIAQGAQGMIDSALYYVMPESLYTSAGMTSAMNSIGNISNIGLGVTTLGASLLSNAIFKGKGYSSIGGTIGSTLGALTGPAIGSALGAGSAASLGAAAGSIIPGIGNIVGAILGSLLGGALGSLFGKEPRWGALIAQTGGKTTAYEDSAYAKGAFGLSFGLNDKGSKNVDASKLQPVFQGLADITTLLAQFFGEDLSNFIKDDLAKITAGPYDWLHLTENEQDLAGAMNKLVEQIAASAGRSGQELGIAFEGMLGPLSGTAEEIGAQIESAMQAAALAVEVSKRWDEQLGQMLGLTGNLAADVDLLRGYADQFGKSSETSAQTLTRLVAQLGLLGTAAEQTATKIDGLSTQALVEISDGLVKAFGGLDKAASAISVYQAQFASATAQLVKTIQAAAGDIDRGVPKLKEAIVKLGQDLTTTVKRTIEETIAVPLTLADLFASGLNQEDPFATLADYWSGGMTKLQTVTREVTDTITTLGDPSALGLAGLLDSLPRTRQGFIDLVAGIDLATAAGQQLYAGLLELAPQFDLLYDGVEAFSDWLLGVDAAGKALRELTAVFDGWGMSLPANRDALLALYQSGVLTTEQIAILGAYVRELGLVFGDLATGTIVNPDNPTETITGPSLADHAQAAYDALAKAVAAEKEAIQATSQARLNALSTERQAAQQALTAAQAALSSIQSAIAALRGNIGIDEFSRIRAQRQLAAWAASGTLPSADDLNQVLPAATAISPADFATEAAYRASQATTLASLLKLEQAGLKQTSVAERTLAAIDDQTQQAQAAAQAQLDRLDALLATAKAQLDQASGSATATLSLGEAIQAFNAALAAYNPGAAAVAMTSLGTTVTTSLDDLGTRLSTDLASQTTQQTVTASQQREDLTALKAELAALRADLAASNTASVTALKSVDNRLQRWDLDGLPAARDDATTYVLQAA